MKLDKYLERCKKVSETVYVEREEGNFHTQLIPKMVEEYFCKQRLPLDAFILDVGCGEGTFLDVVRNLGYENVLGVTMSPFEVTTCVSKGHDVKLADMADMSVEYGSVDMIWARQSVEHSPYPYYVLMEFYDCLKAGGKLYLEVPAENTERYHESNPNHYSVMGARMWASLLIKAGFECNNYNDFKFDIKIDEQVTVKEHFYIFVATKPNLQKLSS